MPRLNQRRVDSLEPRKSVHHVRDSELKGFGVRILPSGRKTYVLHTQHQGERIWKTLGHAHAMTESEARSRAVAVLASIRSGHACALSEETVFEAVAETVFRRYRGRWKASTFQANQYYYRNQILPWFRGQQIADIDRQDVRNWQASLHATPSSADRAAPILSVIMTEAEACGYREADSNPCRGLKRYSRASRDRFLSHEEIRRLARVLARHGDHRLAAAVRLLLLTGCRKSEILTLRWTDYREGKLFLRDSKTGPRTVWLSSAARNVLDDLERRSPWVFPTPQRSRGHGSRRSIDHFWHRVRAGASLNDVRLHDLRHTYASIALMQGETVLAIGRLLGHNDPGTTLKYTHSTEASARTATDAVASVLGGNRPWLDG